MLPHSHDTVRGPLQLVNKSCRTGFHLWIQQAACTSEAVARVPPDAFVMACVFVLAVRERGSNCHVLWANVVMFVSVFVCCLCLFVFGHWSF